jgi:5-methylcytosine-specific restriction endonuclease McrA
LNKITKSHDKICLACNKDFIAPTTRHSFCIDCRAIRRVEKNKNNRNGRSGYLKIRFQLLSDANFTCQYCGRHAPDVPLEIDHVVPINKGGKDELENWIVACSDCNKGKSDVILGLRKAA